MPDFLGVRGGVGPVDTFTKALVACAMCSCCDLSSNSSSKSRKKSSNTLSSWKPAYSIFHRQKGVLEDLIMLEASSFQQRVAIYN